MSQLPKILARDTVSCSRIFHVESLQLEFSNGEHRTYERLLGGKQGSVLVVPMLDDDTVLLVREYAAGSHDYQLGLPKGRMEPEDDDPLQAADRELREEVGYGARDLQILNTLTIAPAYIQHHTHIVLARDLFPDKQPGDEPEPIEVVPWRLSDWQALMAQPDLTEARSIAALYMTRDFLQ
ncbi:MAG: ADP compounds hydrolase NudE [Candidatus Thiodiazotropha sp. (ex Monitilora ramsayi)]|nr:ADP compounds hydrolase NudE [Candidatus Thiodiazotropha sp. (ex Monitilora ramsayi)]